MDAIADGLRADDLQVRLDELSERRDGLQRTLDRDAAPPPVRLHPNLADVYRRKVEQLHTGLREPDIRDEAVATLQSLIERVVIHRTEAGPQIELVGEIVRMIELTNARGGNKKTALDEAAARSVKVVAGAGLGLCDMFRAERLECPCPAG